MSNDVGELRRSAVISTHGPGAIVDFRAGQAAVSGIVAGLEEWDSSFPKPGLLNIQVVYEERLQKKLRVRGFRVPPVLDEKFKGEPPDNRRLVAVTFPQWLQCPECDLLKPARRWATDPGKAGHYCAKCSAKEGGARKVFTVPVRFVLACKNGHVDEFPWDWWVEHKPDCPVKKIRLLNRHPGLRLEAKGPGLAGLILSCPKCNARKSMDGIFSAKTWERFGKCSGRRPWIAGGDEECDETPIALQRGASNMYFPVTQSALSIPPWSDQLVQETLGDFWQTLCDIVDDDRVAYIKQHCTPGSRIANALAHLRMTPEELAETIRLRVKRLAEVDVTDLKPAEYQQFTHHVAEQSANDVEFETRTEKVPEEISGWIQHIVRAVRLREVRVLTGFTRVIPPGDPDSDEVARLSKAQLDWLPGIEVRGEGIFLALNEERLAAWEAQDIVIDRVEVCEQQRLKDWAERYGPEERPPFKLTPRLMLCHSLSHILMRQLTLECGYSSASLQERIYASAGDQKMSGLLIYTATTDADGTLGGLQRQGTGRRISGTLQRALQAIEWCSSDPLCITDMMAAIASYSRSTCHSCCLAPETSCEFYNCFLDRALVTGDGATSGLGFFEGLLRRG